MKKLNKKRGISLIVLVITIIVMIVLAAAIILSLQSSGIIDRANEAKSKSDVATAKQVVTMAKAEWELDEAKIKEDNSSIKNFSDYAKSKLEDAGYKVGAGNDSFVVTEEGNLIYSGINTIYVDSDGAYAIIPEGFTVSDNENENTVAEGLVIYEGTDKVSSDGDAATTRNQFVWVPVKDMSDFVMGEFNFTEATTTSYDLSNVEEKTEYNRLKESVKHYGGFYVARYAAGFPEGKTYSDVSLDGTDKPRSVSGQTLWNLVGWDSDYNNDGYGTWNNNGCAKIARSAYDLSNSVKSHLLYGEELFCVLNFDTENIYDMSFSWWTMVTYTSDAYTPTINGRVISDSSWGFPNMPLESIGFRIALYLK